MGNNLLLNRVFSKSTLSDLIENRDSVLVSNVVSRYMLNEDNLTYGDAFSKIYKVMIETHKNEYIFKNTLLNKLLLGVHSINTSTALTEVPINKSIIDFVLINGKAVAYEIKTDLDKFDRLVGQLNDYYKAFTCVCVITSESNYIKTLELLSKSNTGVFVLTNQNKISKRKLPIADYSKLDYTSMFKLLRKHEYESILEYHYGKLPEVRQVEYFTICLEMFKKIELNVVHEYFIKELKKRNRIEKEEFTNIVPSELKFLTYFSDLKKSDYIILEEVLDKKI